MTITQKLKALDAELAILYKSPINKDTEDRIAELEEEYRSLVWEFDARIF